MTCVLFSNRFCASILITVVIQLYVCVNSMKQGLPMIVEDRTPVTATPYMQTNQRLQHDYRQTNSDPSLPSEEQLVMHLSPIIS